MLDKQSCYLSGLSNTADEFDEILMSDLALKREYELKLSKMSNDFDNNIIEHLMYSWPFPKELGRLMVSFLFKPCRHLFWHWFPESVLGVSSNNSPCHCLRNKMPILRWCGQHSTYLRLLDAIGEYTLEECFADKPMFAVKFLLKSEKSYWEIGLRTVQNREWCWAFLVSDGRVAAHWNKQTKHSDRYDLWTQEVARCDTIIVHARHDGHIAFIVGSLEARVKLDFNMLRARPVVRFSNQKCAFQFIDPQPPPPSLVFEIQLSR